MSVHGDVKYEKFGQALRSEIQKEFLAMAEHLTGLLQQNAPVGGDGILRGSFGYGEIANDFGVQVQSGTPLLYGQYVEFGTKPHWVPIDALERWVEAKLQPHVLSVGVSFESGKAVPVKSGTRKLKGNARQKAVQQLARAIQIKIAKRGTTGQKYMEKSLREMGLEFTVDFQNDVGVYSVDMSKFLENRLPSIIERTARQV